MGDLCTVWWGIVNSNKRADNFSMWLSAQG
jgi:hypothetical protein